MSMLKPQLDRIDLGTNSRDTLTSLIKLLSPHVPYSLDILGSILNTGPRNRSLQDIDPSKAFLWSTIPVHSNAITDPLVLFSIVTFSHLSHEFCFFCSSDSSTSTDPATEAEKTHVMHVFEFIRNMGREACPTYNAVLVPPRRLIDAHCIDISKPKIVVGAVHPKWAEVIAPMALCQSPNMRYYFPPKTFACEDLQTLLRGGDGAGADKVEISEIQASDFGFVRGASEISRSDAYLLSRAPYSVCLRFRGDTVIGEDRGPGLAGQPVACALLHTDGTIGALRVGQKYQRRGLGRLVLRVLMQKLDFNNDNADLVLTSNDQDLGGGALGWNWMDTGVYNETGNGFFSSVAGKESSWLCHWTYISIH